VLTRCHVTNRASGLKRVLLNLPETSLHLHLHTAIEISARSSIDLLFYHNIKRLKSGEFAMEQ
jgi:hypothetical protein